MSILIGAGVAFLTKLLESTFDVINNWLLDITGSLASMLYYIRNTRNNTIV